MARTLYVIAGSNGSGKTTFAKEFLPSFAHCEEFVNADLIASGLSPFSPARAALEAGKTMLRRIKELRAAGRSFGFESTLAGKSYAGLFRRMKKEGYRIHLIYLWLPTADLALQRVKDRVRLGGHDVPEVDIRRRFSRGLKHFFSLYRPLADRWTIFDNSRRQARLIAEGTPTKSVVEDQELFGYIESKGTL